MIAPLMQVRQSWEKVGQTLLAGAKQVLGNMAPLMVAHYTLPDLKGRFVHSHKGRARRQHRRPGHRQMWQGMVDAQRKARECDRGTSNAEVGVG